MLTCRLNLNLRGHAYNILGLPFEPIPGGRHKIRKVGSEMKVPKKVLGSDRKLGSDKYLTLPGLNLILWG